MKNAIVGRESEARGACFMFASGIKASIPKRGRKISHVDNTLVNKNMGRPIDGGNGRDFDRVVVEVLEHHVAKSRLQRDILISVSLCWLAILHYLILKNHSLLERSLAPKGKRK